MFNYSVPVLMYHHIHPEDGFITVTLNNFEQQMSYIKRHGYNPITANDLYNFINTGIAPVPKPIMITFDDGFLNNYLYAYPILKKFNLKATIFAITSAIDAATINNYTESKNKKTFCTWQTLKEMNKSGLIEIQAHTHEHKRWDKLYSDKTKRLEALKHDLRRSKELIERNLSKRCEFLAWPWGYYNQDYTEIALVLGYKGMFTVEKGINKYKSTPTRIKRFVIKDKGDKWLGKRLTIYSHPVIGTIYSKIVGKI